MRVKAGLALGLLMLVGVTACGSSGGDTGLATANGSGKPSSSSSAKADGKSDQEKVLEYAKCMRENGIPNFADPEIKDGSVQLMLPEGVDPEKAKEVSEKCKQYMPSGGDHGGAEDPKVTEQLRKFAECMRSNGVPDFPDPQAGGGGMVVDQGHSGLDLNDPKFKSAQQACASFQPSGQLGQHVGSGGGSKG